MSEPLKRPGVGVGVYIFKDGKVLIGKRKGSHEGGTWCAGGHLEMGESWEECARREVLEETDIEIENLRFAGVTNDIFPGGKQHYITIAMFADWRSGEPKIMEPDKFEGEWQWRPWNDLPQPLFFAFQNFLNLGIDPLEF